MRRYAEPGFYEHLHNVCGLLCDGINASFQKHGLVGHVKGLGADCVEKPMGAQHLDDLARLLEDAEVADAKPEQFRRYGSARQLYNFKVDNATRY